jgi:hypothetical protein
LNASVDVSTAKFPEGSIKEAELQIEPDSGERPPEIESFVQTFATRELVRSDAMPDE